MDGSCFEGTVPVRWLAVTLGMRCEWLLRPPQTPLHLGDGDACLACCELEGKERILIVLSVGNDVPQALDGPIVTLLCLTPGFHRGRDAPLPLLCLVGRGGGEERLGMMANPTKPKDRQDPKRLVIMAKFVKAEKVVR